MSNFWQRAITGTIFVVVLVGAIMLGGIYLNALFGLIVFFGLLEFYKIFASTDTKPQAYSGAIFGLTLYVIAVWGFHHSDQEVSLFMLGLVVSLSIAALILFSIIELFRNKKNPIENVAVTFVGLVYIVLPFFLLSTFSRYDPPQQSYDFWPLLSIFILIWCNDTFAYLTGRLLGKHKLFERISPKKTWEGFIGGIIFAVVAGVLMAYLLEWSYTKMVVFGLIAGIIGTAGDLVESMMKRSVGVKDSGNILPGHGGILDRFDAVLFVAPVIFIVEKIIF